MAVFCIVDASGNIVNRALADDAATCPCPAGCTLVADDDYAIGGTFLNGVYTAPPSSPLLPLPPSVLPQDLMAQFTAADIAAIQVAIASNSAQATLWYAMLAQRDPMLVSNARFQTGWQALVSVLGQARTNAIATALGVISLVV